MSVTIYHNPRCKTSCAVLKILKSKGHEPIIIDYLLDPPGKSDLIQIINHLRVSPWDIVRKKEAKDLGLKKETDLTSLISTIAKNPSLMEYPIVLTSTQGRICRPAQIVDEIVGHA